jgi:hypothetical protein
MITGGAAAVGTMDRPIGAAIPGGGGAPPQPRRSARFSQSMPSKTRPNQPPVYDYGVNVVYQGDEVYVDGKPSATAKQYSQQAIALANTAAEQPPPPTPPQQGQQPEWLPLGVWALAQEEKGDAYMFFQLSIDKNGVVTGAYQNVLSGENAPISGQVDKKTQRIAWKIGTNNTVIETGFQSLTKDVAPR